MFIKNDYETKTTSPKFQTPEKRNPEIPRTQKHSFKIRSKSSFQTYKMILCSNLEEDQKFMWNEEYTKQPHIQRFQNT